jgi:serine/threonine protein kinase
MLLNSRYDILEKIGVGGMGIVYKGYDIHLKRNVAIKILKEEFIDQKELINKFKKEAQSIAKLSHKNIVSVYDVGNEKDVHFIIMEYIDGISLNQLLQRKKVFDYKSFLTLFVDICKGIAHAHENNIVHRDIKPHNILLTKNGHPKVADFGIAKILTETKATKTGTIWGSLYYCSPEQAKGLAIDRRSDVYSLGITLYEMFIGSTPFEGDSVVSIIYKHIQEIPKNPSEINRNIPKELGKIIMRMLEKNPSDRYQDVRDIIMDINNILINRKLEKEDSKFQIKQLERFIEHQSEIKNDTTILADLNPKMNYTKTFIADNNLHKTYSIKNETLATNSSNIFRSEILTGNTDIYKRTESSQDNNLAEEFEKPIRNNSGKILKVVSGMAILLVIILGCLYLKAFLKPGNKQHLNNKSISSHLPNPTMSSKTGTTPDVRISPTILAIINSGKTVVPIATIKTVTSSQLTSKQSIHTQLATKIPTSTPAIKQTVNLTGLWSGTENYPDSTTNPIKMNFSNQTESTVHLVITKLYKTDWEAYNDTANIINSTIDVTGTYPDCNSIIFHITIVSSSKVKFTANYNKMNGTTLTTNGTLVPQ